MTLRSLLAAAAAAAAALGLAVAPAAALEPLGDVGENPGMLDGFVLKPPVAGAGAPLVVALHGCTQGAADFDDETGLAALAREVPFVLLLPEQREANNAQRCFNWFRDRDNRRGRGETASIMAMIDHVEARFATDPDRVHVLGLSAGGSMTAVLMANHPDRFAGGGIVAGTPFGCNAPRGLAWPFWWASRLIFGEAGAASLACGLFGYAEPDLAPTAWGDLVREAAGGAPASWPLVSLWQGEADTIVNPANQAELVEQWTNVHGIDAEADVTDSARGVGHQAFHDAAGKPRVVAYRLDAFPHALPIDADGEPVPCGTPADFTRDANLCAVRSMARFWGLASTGD